MKIALLQMNPIVGDLENNYRKIIDFSGRAKEQGVDLLITPELSLLGYPPKDLLIREDFLSAQIRMLDKIGKVTETPVLVGAALPRDERHLPYNAAFLCHSGKVIVVGKKILLPNYNVFDEKRYFSTNDDQGCHIFSFKNKRLLLSICEDAWNSISLDGEQKYDQDPIDNAIKKQGNVDVIINIMASPFSIKKPAIREKIFTHLAKKYHVPLLVSGQVGGNDQLLFDGHSMVIDDKGHIVQHAQACVEDLLIFDADAPSMSLQKYRIGDDELLIKTLTMGVKDYVDKCRLKGVIIGLSGGIDSAVVLSLAVMALGKERVRCVYMPSKFSSETSFLDASLVASNLGLTLDVLPIEDSVQSLRTLFSNEFLSTETSDRDLFDQNIQSRLRGLIIMALTNLFDHVMIATSNKSELAVGYSTIYGDMCGAFSLIGDLYKTQVYALAHTINKRSPVIPQSIIDKPPTAELKPDQLDTDLLPEYFVLDQILMNFIDYEKNIADIVKITGFKTSLVEKIIAMVNQSEYKRRQGPFPLMVSDKVFGDARRLPIAKNFLFK